MVVPLARLAVLIKGLSLILRGYRDFLENYPVDVIVFRALKGKRGSSEDIASLDKDVAAMFGIPYVYS
jgi:hypothetical protein